MTISSARVLAKRNRAAGWAALNGLFRAGTPPTRPLNGRYAGELVMLHIAPGLTQLVNAIVSAWLPWKGKSFDAATSSGDNIFTRDSLFESPDPVTAMAVGDLDGGGRVYVQATDCDPSEIAIDARVELVLRRIHDGGCHPNYSWKARPIG